MTHVSKLVLGTVQFGCQYGINSAGRPSQDAVNTILSEAYAGGITTLDTSCAYGDAERVLGATGEAGKFRIVSKFLQTPGESVENVFAKSLRQLGTDRVYGYLIHHFSDWTDSPSLWGKMQEIRDKGLTERIGFSLYSPSELGALLDAGIDFNLVQIPHNIFDRKFDPYLPQLQALGVEVHVRSTFLQGLFFKDRDTLPEKIKPLRKYLLELDEYSKSTGTGISELALNYNIRNPYISGVLIGVDNVEQLKANIASLSDKAIDLDINVKEQELLNPVNWK